MDLPPGLPISQADWEQTPRVVQGMVNVLWQLIGSLKHQVAEQQEQITKQQEQVTRLEGEVVRLSEKVHKNSQNSSKPPSSDGPGVPPRPKGEPSG